MRLSRHRVSARVRRRRVGAVLLLLVLVLTTTSLSRDQGPEQPAAYGATTPVPTGVPTGVPAGGPSRTTAAIGAAAAPASQSKPAALAVAAGLGPRTVASVPARSTQVVVVRGDARSSATAGVELYQRSAAGWVRSAAWRGHVGAKGWTSEHREGDLRTPMGTYSLSDAGGRAADPGTALPYHRSDSFVPTGDSVFGDSLEGSFDYVVAIDYNRRAGRSPLDPARPLGQARGGGIWLHVDHGGPTHGCVSVPEAGMTELLRSLGPTRHPVVVMGDAAALRT